MRFRDWLRNSNEAQPFRDAFLINDSMPIAFGLKSRCFGQIQSAAEVAWEQTKRDLGL